VIVWGVNQDELDRYKADMTPMGFKIQTTLEPEDIASTCNVIVTATPSDKPLLKAGQIRKGTHITAMGSDTSEKQELDSNILKKADRVIVDSIPQSLLRGEVYKALESGAIKKDRLVELGAAISARNSSVNPMKSRSLISGVAVRTSRLQAVWKVVTPKK
jgi:ornithine cyclodeaminase